MGKFKFYEYQQEDVDKLIDQPFGLIGSENGYRRPCQNCD